MWKAITPVMERINDHKLNVLVIDTFHRVVNQCLVLEAEACEGLTDTLIGSNCEAISFLRGDEVLLTEVLQCSRTRLQMFLGIIAVASCHNKTAQSFYSMSSGKNFDIAFDVFE